MGKVLENVIKAESQKIVLAQHSVEGAKEQVGINAKSQSGERLLRNTHEKAGTKPHMCIYLSH